MKHFIFCLTVLSLSVMTMRAQVKLVFHSGETQVMESMIKTIRTDIDTVIISTTEGTSPYLIQDLKGIQWNDVMIIGDVNSDQKINTGDLVGLVNIILNLNTENLNREVADVNKDGYINVGDCVALTNIILYGDAQSTAPLFLTEDVSANLLADDFTIGAGEVYSMAINITGTDRCAAMQMDITLPEGLTFKSAQIAGNHTVASAQQPDGKIRILAYSPENAMFDNSIALTVNVKADALAEGIGRVVFDGITVADANSATTSLDVTYATVTFAIQTNLENVMNDDTTNDDVYNILGQRIQSNQLEKGIYITNGKKSAILK